MRPIFRPCFVVAAALLVVGLFSAQEARAQAVAPHDVLISEFRLSGPGGDSDEFIEFYCNRDTDCDISNFVIQAHDPSFGDFTVSFPDDTVIPARQYLLVGDSSQYSLPDYATLDFDVSSGFDFFIDNEGLQLLADDEETVIDSVGFIGGGNASTYIEGTGLQPATDARPADQYSYVRKRTMATNGLPQDTDNNAEDFVLVSVTGAAHPGITAPPVLGAPGPQGLDSPPTYDKTQFPDSLVEPDASPQTSPNRVRTGSGDSGTLSIRRTVTNNTDQAFDYISFRVIEIPTLNSPQTISGQAELRLVTSPDAETFTNGDGRKVTIRGTILEFDPDADTEPAQPNGGGLNSTVQVNLGPEELILPGETVDVQFLLNVVHAGNYRFFLYVEAFPSEVPPSSSAVAHSRSINGKATAGKTVLSPAAPRRLIGTKPGAFVTPSGSRSKKTLKKPLAMPSNAPPPAAHGYADDPTTRRTPVPMPGRTPPSMQGSASASKPGRSNVATPPAPAGDDADGARPKRSSILAIQKNN
ncbi:MAG TPA: lamin tail domain-containing protein [Pyrinomonadaceae bacterium]|nr:lamin tail domain-containing protein [Pyrinomonadaceae bacterium]